MIIFASLSYIQIYSVLQIGDYHLNHCEDYLFIGDIGTNKILCAVMDGCTMATDSYFVSTLVGKLLRKIAKEKSYREFYDQASSVIDTDTCLKSILQELFRELRLIKNQLQLEQNEMLTTLIVLVADKRENTGTILVLGDGFVSINGVYTEFDQENKPDYIGFHLQEDFETWYKLQSQKIKFDFIDDISIATDGIFMFAPVKNGHKSEIIHPVNFLVTDKTGMENREMLELKLKKMEHEAGLKPTDDLALIRIIGNT